MTIYIQPKNLDEYFELIGGSGGGGKGGSAGGNGSGFVEAPNDLRSTQTALVIDLISEGPIVGLVNDPRSNLNLLYSVAFDGTRVVNADRTFNFGVADWQFRYGTPAQAILAGYPAASSETAVGAQMKFGLPLVRTITNSDADIASVTLSVPSLSATDSVSGNVIGYGVSMRIELQSNGGGFALLGDVGINGKTTSKYQREYGINLPPGGAPWDIRIGRNSPDSTSELLQNDTYWDSYTTIINSPINFNMSAVSAWKMTADQFQSIPQRSYNIDGRIIAVPVNYNAATRTYTGSWNGAFQQAFTSNPAWVLYDMLINRRYGLGRYIDPNRIDKFALYRIAQYCDGLVPDGKGGLEPRYQFNGAITDRNDAFTVINSLCACFRGSAFWDGGSLTVIADMPSDPVGLVTNANVINGTFTYAGVDISARHNQVLVSWQDQTNFGDQRVAIVEDQDDITVNGVKSTTLDAIGCTSEGLATRYGKWMIYTETMEADTVTFSVGLDGVFMRPGDVIEIADVIKAGKRRAGRIMTGSTDTIIVLDAPAQLVDPGEQPFLAAYVDDAPGSIDQHIEVIAVGSISDDGLTVTLTSAFSIAPTLFTVYMLMSGELQPSLWRVIKVSEADSSTYEISALAHNPTKYANIENNVALSDPQTSAFPSLSVINLTAIDYLEATSSISLAVRMLISWTSTATQFDLEIQPVGGVTNRVRLETTSYDVAAAEGDYRIRVTPLSAIGYRGQYEEITYTVVGKSAAPADVTLFHLNIQGGTSFFSWTPSPDLDVKIGGRFEMRFSPNALADWDSSVPVLLSIPGSASTVEMPYRSGSYLLKAVDGSGNYSNNAALIISSQADSDYTQYVRFCEDPNFLGLHLGTEVRLPDHWLVLGETGGLWDDQFDNMDDWPDVDVLVGGDVAATEGYYFFDNVLDLGGVFTVRLTLDMFAFQLGYGTDFIDDRTENVDDWGDWDNITAGVGGGVQVFIKQTDDDPSDPGATWSTPVPFTVGTYTARGFDFYAYLTAPPGQNVAVEHLCVIADLRNKIDAASDVPWGGTTMHVTYTIKFFLPPSVVVTLQDPRTGDHAKISNKTREGFDIDIFDSSNAPVGSGILTFDWHAAGY